MFPRELIRYAEAVAEKTAGRGDRLGLTRTDTEYRDKIEKRLKRGDDLFSDVPSVYFFTYVDKDGYVPESVSGAVCQHVSPTRSRGA